MEGLRVVIHGEIYEVRSGELQVVDGRQSPRPTQSTIKNPRINENRGSE